MLRINRIILFCIKNQKIVSIFFICIMPNTTESFLSRFFSIFQVIHILSLILKNKEISKSLWISRALSFDSSLHTVWIHGSRESSSGEAAGVSRESNECGRWDEINDDDKCNAAGEIDMLSEPQSPKSGVVIGPLILWLEYEWGDEDDPEDDGQGDKLIEEESTDPTEIEQPNWLFITIGDDNEAFAWNGA